MRSENTDVVRTAFSISEAAQSMGVSENTLRELIRKRPDFPVLQISTGRKIVPVHLLVDWLSREVSANKI